MITATIESVFKQTYPDFELIIVDDGSSDNTEQTIKERYSNNEKLRYFYKQNEERGAARNFGLKQAKGDFAIFFDSDDLMHDNHLEVLNSYITKLEAVNIIATKHNWLRSGNIKPSTIQKIKEGWYGKELFIEGNGLACNFCVRVNNPSLILFREDRKLVTMEDWIFLLENTCSDKIFIIDKTTLTLVDHNERSLTMNFQITSAKRLYATSWIAENIHLDTRELTKLKASSYVFCSVFSYLAKKNLQSLSFLFKAIRIDGLDKKKVMLFFKNIMLVNWWRH